jgi:thioredoxin reductase
MEERETVMETEFELVIVGGGPAGLSAALVAGRARRRVLLVDGGRPRNAAAPEVHTFLTRDGIPPAEFRRIAREQLAVYPTVSFADSLVDNITGEPGALRVSLTGANANGGAVTARRVLLASGLVDTLPDIAGVADFWGRGVHHCPYCDGYVYRDGRWGVLVDAPALFEHAAFLTAWTADVIVFTNGATSVPDAAADLLRAADVAIEPQPIARLRGGSHVDAVELTDGRTIPLHAFWVKPKQRQTDLVVRLGLALAEDGAVRRDEQGQTSMAGVYAAGDLSAGPMQQAILAAAEGARVTFGINRELVLQGIQARPV